MSDLPIPLGAPNLSELTQALKALRAVSVDPGELRPKIVAIEDDWCTQGAWLGRYGRYMSDLCAVQGGDGDYYWGSGWELAGSHWSIGSNHSHSMKIDVGRIGDELRYWNTINYTRDARALELPAPFMDNRVQNHSTTWDVNRRIASIDDHGETYTVNQDGPNILGTGHVPHGLFYLSLYDLNDNGHRAADSCRDYSISAWLSPADVRSGKSAANPAARLDAHCRIQSFYNGVWKRFVVRGPTDLTIELARTGSVNTILSAMTLDLVDEKPAPYFQTPEQWLAQTVERRRRLKSSLAARNAERPATEQSETGVAARIMERLDDLQLVNSTWWAVNGRGYYAMLLRFYLSREATGKSASLKLIQSIATCFYELNQFSDWERYLSETGMTSARQTEQALRWKEGSTFADDFEMVTQRIRNTPATDLHRLSAN